MKYSFLILALVYTGCSTPKAAPPATDTAAPTIRCNEHPLPEFSLAAGETSNEAAVCDCIWSHLSEQDRQVATNLRNGIANEASIMKSFPIRFGQAIGTCTTAVLSTESLKIEEAAAVLSLRSSEGRSSTSHCRLST